ncbi:cell shape-determining protein MreD [Thalassospira profundimaris]|uniref:Cell shape-determining protein MreD n=1 Tax=Thalassospira profundimaris TaxID=502049 RepID=A0A367WNT4_9PROT|nr:rod shape-determining protein MreD [Thalassospira profundimaris]RCK43136.1 cell shape-determining protein MreD [Thalassospira profundimaris]
MKPGVWQRLDVIARSTVPAFSVFVLLLVGLLPYSIPKLADVTPALTLMAVFFWAVNRPDLMTGFAAFMLGLIQDLLTGLPLGVSSLVFLLVQAASANQGRFFHNKAFTVMWWGFAIVAGPAFLLQWLFSSALSGALLPFVPLMISYLITAGMFPLVAWILVRIQNGLLRNL